MLNKPYSFILIHPSFYLSTPVFWLTHLHNLQKKKKKYLNIQIKMSLEHTFTATQNISSQSYVKRV